MSLPTLEQYKKSAATWRRDHKGIAFTLSHHGASDYSPEGTWCFYIHLLEEQFVHAEDFAKFNREEVVKPSFGDSFWQTHDYCDVPDHGFHGGITWYSRERYIAKKTGEPKWALKIGCDYNHSWDRDGGYWQGLEDVARDAVRLIDKLVEEVAFKDRCSYSGVYGLPEEFYAARNGSRVHRSQVDKFSEEQWAGWLPAETAVSA